MHSFNLSIEKQVSETLEDDSSLPSFEQLDHWTAETLFIQETYVEGHSGDADIEICVRFVSSDEIKELNLAYRGKNKATNILSFESDVPDFVDELNLLGDLVVCHEVIEAEAKQLVVDEYVDYNEMLEAHWAHIIVHGVLHLLNYDHEVDEEAEHMEALEIKVMEHMGFSNPYLDSSDIED